MKLFHDKNYESVLDGEIIETGAGLVLRKKVSKLSELFLFRPKKKKKNKATSSDAQSTKAVELNTETKTETETQKE